MLPYLSCIKNSYYYYFIIKHCLTVLIERKLNYKYIFRLYCLAELCELRPYYLNAYFKATSTRSDSFFNPFFSIVIVVTSRLQVVKLNGFLLLARCDWL